MAEQEEYIIKLKDQFGKSFSGLRNMVRGFNSEVKGLQSRVSNVGGGISSSFKGIAGSLAPMIAGIASLGAIKSVVQLGMDAEQAQVSFEVMLGSAEKAKKMVADLKAMGAATPFEFTHLQDATKTLLAFGIEGKAILPTLQALGDVSGGNADKLQSLATVFGQISSTGRLMGGDLLQLINNGFNPLKQMSQKTGRSMGDLKKDMEKGLISFDMVQQSFADATSKGGLFYQMMEKQSQTTAGRLSTLQDQIAAIGTSIGTAMLPSVNAGMDKISYAFDWMKQNFEQLKAVFAPIVESFQPMIDVFKDIAADMGLMSGEGNILKSIFNGIGSVISWISPLIKFFANNTAMAIGFVWDLIKGIWALIKPFAKLLGYKEKDFGFQDVKAQEATKTQSLDDFIKTDGAGKPGSAASSTTAAKNKRINDSISGVSGGRPTNITINIGALIKEYTNQITSVGGQVDLKNLEDKIKQVLMTALNDSQIIVQG